MGFDLTKSAFYFILTELKELQLNIWRQNGNGKNKLNKFQIKIRKLKQDWPFRRLDVV